MNFILQKICSFCSSKQLNLFEDYLSEKNQQLSVQLIRLLKKYHGKQIKYYCKAIYGDTTIADQKKFNQLNHHTLQYFSFISQYFPSFLSNGLNEIDYLILVEKYDVAIERTIDLCDSAQKLEDFGILIRIAERCEQYNFLANALNKKINDRKKAEFINCLYNIERLLALQVHLVNQSVKNISLSEDDLTLFKTHFTSPFISLSIMAKQSYLFIKSAFNHSSFYEKSTLKLIQSTKQLIDKNPYLIIARHREKLMSLDYMLVKHTRLSLNEKDLNTNCTSIINRWQKFYHTNNQLDSGLMLALSIKASFYITDYYFKDIPEKLFKEIQDILVLLNELELAVDWEITNYLKLINFYNVKAMFLILLFKEKESIRLIEKIMHEYQQKPFKKMYDGLFVVLIMAYFQAKDFDGVIDSFNRYKKLMKCYVSVEENDLVIHSIYYLAQYNLTSRLQYKKKMNEVKEKLTSNPKLKNNLLLIQRLKSI